MSRQEADALLTEITAALWGTENSSSNSAAAVRAHGEGQVALLRVFRGLVHDRTVRFSEISSLFEIMAAHGVDPEANITAERVRAYINCWMWVMEAKSNHPEMVGGDASLFIVMSSPEERQAARLIVSERWPGSLEQARGLLEETKGVANALSTGVL